MDRGRGMRSPAQQEVTLEGHASAGAGWVQAFVKKGSEGESIEGAATAVKVKGKGWSK